MSTETCWITWPVTPGVGCRAWQPGGWPWHGCEQLECHHGAHRCRCGATLGRVHTYVAGATGTGGGG